MEDAHVVIDDANEFWGKKKKVEKGGEEKEKEKEKDKKKKKKGEEKAGEMDADDVIRSNLSKYKRVSLYCIFDGHGGFASGIKRLSLSLSVCVCVSVCLCLCLCVCACLCLCVCWYSFH